jgi:hypothetical protein
MSNEYLATYLNDHLAGSQTALEILDRLAKPPVELKTEIEEDSEVLKNLMATLGIAESRLRKAAGWVGDKVVSMKTRIEDSEGGPLHQLESLEALAVGVDGKLALWSALAAAAEVDPALAILDYDRLIERALDQRARIEVWRLEAAQAALVPNQSKRSA